MKGFDVEMNSMGVVSYYNSVQDRFLGCRDALEFPHESPKVAQFFQLLGYAHQAEASWMTASSKDSMPPISKAPSGVVFSFSDMFRNGVQFRQRPM